MRKLDIGDGVSIAMSMPRTLNEIEEFRIKTTGD